MIGAGNAVLQTFGMTKITTDAATVERCGHHKQNAMDEGRRTQEIVITPDQL